MNNRLAGLSIFGRNQRKFDQFTTQPVESRGQMATLLNQKSSQLLSFEDETKKKETSADPQLNYWRNQSDPLYAYTMDKRMQLTSGENSQIEAMTRWYHADIKGHKRTLYTKQVAKMNDKIQIVTDLDRLELLTNKNDRWPLSGCRKSLMRCAIRVNMASLNIIKMKWFEAATILVIMANCFTLATSKADQEPTETENMIENIFLALYSIEMVLKILGLGFIFNKGAYLRDPFNILDFFIVMSSYLSMMQDQTEGQEDSALSLSSLRAFRVLRPLRAVNNIPGLRLIVQSILSALPLLKDTIIVLLFFFLIFAIGGVNLFSGMLRQRCINVDTGATLLDSDDNEVICGDAEGCMEGYFCGKRIMNPNYDTTNFDSIFWAMLVIFQCVTLEGWSDIMVLYQKTYNYYVFLFFVPLVFIGAFFLLNLTLAVINTSFKESQDRVKKAKIDRQRELEQLFQEKKNEGGTDNLELEAGAAKSVNRGDLDQKTLEHKAKQIGVINFFIAQKAAQKMRAYAKRYHEQKAQEEKERQRKEQEELELMRLGSLSPKQLIRRRSSTKLVQFQGAKSQRSKSPTLLAKPEVVEQSKSHQKSQQSSSQTNELLRASLARKMSGTGTGPSEAVSTVTPQVNLRGADVIIDEHQSEDQKTSRSVEQFLKGLQSEYDAVDRSKINSLEDSDDNCKSMSEELCTENLNSFMQPKSQAQIVMAFNDLRRANARDLITQEEKFYESNTPKHLIKYRESEHTRRKIQTNQMHQRIQKELDFDQVMEKSRNYIDEDKKSDFTEPPKKKQTRAGEAVPDQHEFDLSYLKSDAGFFSDNEEQGGKKGDNQSLILTDRPFSDKDVPNQSADIAESVILSDSSLASAMDRFRKPKVKTKSKRLEEQPMQQQVTHTLKRMLTSDPKLSTKLGENDIDESIYGGQSTNFKQQIDLYFHLNERPQKAASPHASPKPTSTARSSRLMDGRIRGPSSYSLALAKVKKEKQGIYQQVSQDLLANSQNPYMHLNRKKQKIVINPGEKYISASQQDVFELRNRQNLLQRIKERNPYISLTQAQENSEETRSKRKSKTLYEDSEDERDKYVRAPFWPYQLKHKYRAQKFEEVEIEDDDEDAVLLQEQPFETVTSIGHAHLLSHLETKLLARRSDIIVSSTLSISLTPQDSCKQVHLTQLNEDEIQDYINLRSEYRAMGIKQCSLALDNDQSILSDSEDDEESEYETIPRSSLPNQDGSQSLLDSLESDQLGQPKFLVVKKNLPKTLLREPLSPEQVMLLSDKAKHEYNLQKSKYDATSRQFFKNGNNRPDTTKFALQDARALVNGEYFNEDEEQELLDQKNILDKQQAGSMSQTVLLNRMDLGADQSLAIFEQAVKEIIRKNSTGSSQSLEQLNKKDCIPDEIKEEFNLPEQMKGNQVDFSQVRLQDTTMVIKHPIWSGQEVLASSLSQDQSKWVLGHLSAVRVWPKGFKNIVKKARSVLKISCMNPLFENLMTLCVLLNTVVMSMDRYGIDEDTENTLNQMNAVFTYIFIYEMGVKLLAIGPKKYVASKWNLLDGSVVLLSIIEMIAESSQSENSGGGSSISAFRTVRVFRTFRVLRVARILRALHSMQVIIGVITRSFKSFMYVILLLFVFVFIYALLGIQIYQGKFDFGPHEQLPRGNFEDFGIAFVTVFQVLTMENWQEVLYSAMRSARGSAVMKSLTAIYFISWIFIGNFILLNLFLAILIDSFNSEESETADGAEEETEVEKKAREIKALSLLRQKKKRLSRLALNQPISPEKNQLRRQGTFNLAVPQKKQVLTFTGQKKREEDMIEDLDELGTDDIRNMLIVNKIINVSGEKRRPLQIPVEIHCNNSVYLFPREGSFRKQCYRIQQHRYFDRFIMFLILVSSLQLAFETYIQDLPKDSNVLLINDIFGEIFTYCFLIECLLKVIALGFVIDQGSYLRESWNQLDFFIVATSLIDRALVNSDVAAFRILRMLRILRPLRVVSHNVQLKMIVIALLDAGGSIFNVIVVVLVVWLMFAIFAINTYKGHFFHCSVNQYEYQDKYDCIEKGGEWLRYDSNFDDIGQAMMTLFIVSSLEGWPTIMYQALDITRVDYGPQFQGNIKQAIFFIVFILIGSFFFLNFFIGVLFLKYSEAQKREIAGFSEKQLFWREMQMMILKAKCSHAMRNQPQVWEYWRLKAWRVVNSSTFESAILVVIVLNMIQMGIIYEGASQQVNTFIELTNFVFTAIFVFEAILKIIAFKLAYFQTGWNRFDFFVVIASILDIFFSYYEKVSFDQGGEVQQQSALSVGPQLARVLRVLRVSRVLRIAGHYKGLKSLLNTITLSVNALLNVFMLLMLFFFILATLGQFMFSQVKSGNVINEYKNFGVFDRSFLLLFSISTGEDWNRIMYDCYRQPPDCIEGETCGSAYAPVYFIAFIVLVTYVMLNLFILVIIQQFQKLYLDQNSPLSRFNKDFEMIHEVWVKFTARTRCLKLKELHIYDFMKAIPAPLGFHDLKPAELKKATLRLNIKSEEGYIYFNELLYRLLRNQYGNFKLNPKMQIRELITQFKIFNLTVQHFNKTKRDLNERFVRKIGGGGADTVNPFLTQMYYRISFLAWVNHMKKYVKQEKINQIREISRDGSHMVGLDADVIHKLEISQSMEKQYEEVEIEVEHFSEVTISDEEQSPPQAVNSGTNSQDSESAGDFDSHTHTMHQQISPLLHRRKSRFRMQKTQKPQVQIDQLGKVEMTEMHLYLQPEFNSLVRKYVKKRQPMRRSSTKIFDRRDNREVDSPMIAQRTLQKRLIRSSSEAPFSQLQVKPLQTVQSSDQGTTQKQE